ncbi:aminotransferase class I/II-fold pyridoxal phosphate-dependent enzyme [Butyrivibrio sp. VCD2006]|uniref:aminotransferase class I/II-fold pyridoxal phosphate-dependent enzyme n=1 Tax=Butyrivibrio sp. VCD2006 TaxID=1280664 RepID=UPI0004013C72|nr:hypothetical protein [Butyrivibrio sp. VCD2006]
MNDFYEKNEKALRDSLKGLSESELYPLHMPGHKRNPDAGEMADYMDIDITEIDDYDNLHDAEGIIKDAEARANELYGADETHFLINGSTCGVLSAISAAVPKGGKIIAARNVHKSFYHAAYLRELEIAFVMPRSVYCTKNGLEKEAIKEDKVDSEKKKDLIGGRSRLEIMGAVAPEDIEDAFLKNPEAKAVFITSPTYEGVVSNVRVIADVAHRHGAVLIVDEAHGAHFGLYEKLAENQDVDAHQDFGEVDHEDAEKMQIPDSAVHQGADIVIHSVHKTLAAMTQTALIHVVGNRVDRERLRRFLRIYQSSSPSYVLMASIDASIKDINDRGKERFDKLLKYRSKLESKTEGLKKLFILPCRGDWSSAQEGNDRDCVLDDERPGSYSNGELDSKGTCADCMQDPCKVLVCSADGAVTGQQIYDILRLEYKLQCEMAGDTYALAIITGYDTEEGIERLIGAVRDLDRRISAGEIGSDKKAVLRVGDEAFVESDAYRKIDGKDLVAVTENEKIPGDKGRSKTILSSKSHGNFERMKLPETVTSFYKAWDGDTEEVDISRAAGRVAGDFINLYPPGIPLVIPGELISRELVAEIGNYINEGRNIQGVRITANGARLLRCLCGQ